MEAVHLILCVSWDQWQLKLWPSRITRLFLLGLRNQGTMVGCLGNMWCWDQAWVPACRLCTLPCKSSPHLQTGLFLWQISDMMSFLFSIWGSSQRPKRPLFRILKSGFSMSQCWSLGAVILGGSWGCVCACVQTCGLEHKRHHVLCPLEGSLQRPLSLQFSLFY